MEYNNYQKKHPRGSSPPIHEIEMGIDRSVSRISFTKQTPIDAKREKQKKELIKQISESAQQADDAGRWQDDGGECG